MSQEATKNGKSQVDTYLESKIVGSIPEDLFNKQQLDAIFLNNNQLDSDLLQNLGNSRASVINLANKKFIGNIPFSLGYIGSRVRKILVLNNQLTGCIPEGVGL
ncbi:Leucine-rich repeat (LRR) family protein [Abeliophyllum distichum]|uniref:Leucine-rich repeat (LRR) family protein n=1 Tax=Abeliophyllum distichum TaxID=126358 RepID=A0ABD1USI3_9LAMI